MRMTSNEFKAMCIESGFTYPQLAELLNCSRSSVSKFANLGDKEVPLKFEVVLEKLLGKKRYDTALTKVRSTLAQERAEHARKFNNSAIASETQEQTQPQKNDAHNSPTINETDNSHPQLPFDCDVDNEELPADTDDSDDDGHYDDDDGDELTQCPNCNKHWTELEIDCQECLECGYS